MDKTIDVFVKELASLRTGRANASMLDLLKLMWSTNANKPTCKYHYAGAKND